jgi:hypothetical protein
MYRIALTVAVLVLLSGLGVAQTSSSVTSQAQIDRYIETFRTDLRTGKVELYDQSLGLSPADSAEFWPLYREFDYKQSLIGNKVAEVLKEYAQKYDTLTDDEAADLIERNWDNQEELIDLRQEYFNKMSRAIGAKDAGRFFQLEGVITNLLQLKVSAEVPLMK